MGLLCVRMEQVNQLHHFDAIPEELRDNFIVSICKKACQRFMLVFFRADYKWDLQGWSYYRIFRYVIKNLNYQNISETMKKIWKPQFEELGFEYKLDAFWFLDLIKMQLPMLRCLAETIYSNYKIDFRHIYFPSFKPIDEGIELDAPTLPITQTPLDR